MGEITSLFLHKVIRQVDESLDRKGLLAALGIDIEAPVDPSIMVSDTACHEFLEIGMLPSDLPVVVTTRTQASS